jgi:methanogenic corrinoid protein MtbC1
VTAAPPGPLDHPDRDQLTTELVERFAVADRWGAVSRTRELLAAGVEDAELRHVIGAAIRHVGELWQQGSWTVAQEHAATAVAESVLSYLEVVQAPERPVGDVAVVAADGEWHSLPARLVAHAFERAGLHVHYLGAGVPASDVATSLPAARVDVLAVSVTVSANLVGAARTIAAGHAAGVPVLLGGAASSPSRAEVLGADAHAADADEAVRIVRAWCEQGPPPFARSRADLSSAARLTARRGQAIGAAYAVAEERWSGLADADEDLIDRTVEDLELHLGHLAAAVVLDDAHAYVDLVTWLADVHVGRRLPPSALVAQLEGLRTALADEPRVAEFVEAGRASIG